MNVVKFKKKVVKIMEKNSKKSVPHLKKWRNNATESFNKTNKVTIFLKLFIMKLFSVDIELK